MKSAMTDDRTVWVDYLAKLRQLFGKGVQQIRGVNKAGAFIPKCPFKGVFIRIRGVY